MLRGIKIRIYPNKVQTEDLNKILGCYRFVYNHMLDYKQAAYKEQGKSIGLTDLSKHFHGELLKNPDYSWLAEQNTKIMKQSIRQMLTAYANFFSHKSGFPKYKTKKDKQSALFPIEAISNKNTFETRHISLTRNLKDIKFRCSDLYLARLREYKDKIRSATLSKTKSGNYFLSILVDIPDHELVRFKHTNKCVGIDLGVKEFVVTSDGAVFPNKHFNKSCDKRVKRLQKQLSKKQKGSHNREKTRLKLAKLYERIDNRKTAYLHEITNKLLSENDMVFMEDLNVDGMLKNHRIARAISEVGFHRFMGMMEYKCMVNYKYVVKVDRWYASSKICSKCGYAYKGLTLGERQWRCPVCGEVHDRDLNAAINILKEGKRIIGFRRPEFTLVESPTVDDRQAEPGLRSSDSLKQEAETWET